MSSAPITNSDTTPATFTLDHYEHMVACGAFDGDYHKRVELLWGEIVNMTPVGPNHCDDVDYLTEWSVRATLDKPIRIRIQQPIRLPTTNSEPEPDVCWVRQGDYSKQHPNPEDVLLVIEVAESSLATDRGPKLAAYALARIREYWIVNLVDRQLEVYRQPSGQDYQATMRHPAEAAASPLLIPDAILQLRELFK